MNESLLAELEKSRDNGKLSEVAELEVFSAVASGAASTEDFKKLRFFLLVAGISEKNCLTDDDIREITHYITSQVVGRAKF